MTYFSGCALLERKRVGGIRLARLSPELDCRAMAHQTGPSRGVLIRDLIIFQGKLWLDGIKDIVLSPISTGAAILDILSGPRRDGSLRFYRVMKLGERFDLWLNLFGAAKVASNSAEGLFAGSEPGDNTMLGALEHLTERPSDGSEGHLPHRVTKAHGRMHS